MTSHVKSPQGESSENFGLYSLSLYEEEVCTWKVLQMRENPTIADDGCNENPQSPVWLSILTLQERKDLLQSRQRQLPEQKPWVVG